MIGAIKKTDKEIIREQSQIILNKTKQIADLEQENKTVTRKADEAIADKLLITATYNEVLNNLNQENDKLQKENAELKEKYDTCLRENTGLKIHSAYVEKKLTKAKEIIKYLLSFIQKENYKTRWDINIAEAEQFLMDCDIDNAIQQANKGLDFDKIADEMEQDLKESEEEK